MIKLKVKFIKNSIEFNCKVKDHFEYNKPSKSGNVSLLVKSIFMFLLLSVAVIGCKTNNDNRLILKDADKLIIALNEHWDSTAAKIYLLSRTTEDWKFDGDPIEGVIGKKGIGWGIGLHNDLDWEERFPYRPKKEGDKRTPAGLFSLGDIFGYDSILSVKSVKPYTQLKGYMHAVDDTSSIHYNQMVDTNDFLPSFKDHYNSYEDLRFMGEVYQWLFVIDHNPKSIRDEGSNIYFHIRRSNGTGTGGCTAVAEKDILSIIEWLSDSTFILQLPREVYNSLNKELGLPEISN